MPSAAAKSAADLVADSICQIVQCYFIPPYGRHEEHFHPSSGEPETPFAFDGGGNVARDVAQTHVVEPLQVDVAPPQLGYRSTTLRGFPGLTVLRKVPLRDPDDIQLVDAITGRCHGESDGFHLILSAGVAAPERESIPVGAKVRGNGVRRDFALRQLGALQPLGAGDLASQKQASSSQILDHFPEVAAEPRLRFSM